MKKLLFILLIAISSINSYSQDSISRPKLLLRPFFENGIDFIRSNELKQNYQTQSKYFWGFGLQLGRPETFRVIPFAEFSYSTFEVVKTVAPKTQADSALTTKQITGGLIIPLKKIDKVYIRGRLGYNYSMIKESFYNIDSNSHGFQFGLGAEFKFIGYSRLYFDLTYNYQKTKVAEFRDFDMTRFAIGIVL